MEADFVIIGSGSAENVREDAMTTNRQSAAADLRRMIVGYRLSQALHVAAKLGVADLLADGPRHAEDLAVVTGSQSSGPHRRPLCGAWVE